jgi:predicted DNA binding CopG/RHH family protein
MKQKILKPDYNLDPEEIELLDSIDRGEWQPVPNPIEEINKLRKAAKITNQLLKSKNINIRLQPTTLEKLRESAARLGMPYQTLASSILHRYATGQTIIPNT